jgi:hypothetical protein
MRSNNCLGSVGNLEVRKNPGARLDALVVPFTVHGDGARAYSGERSVDIFSWSSLLAHGSELLTRFLIVAIPTRMLTRTAFEEIFSILRWSFLALLKGRWSEPQLATGPEKLISNTISASLL